MGIPAIKALESALSPSGQPARPLLLLGPGSLRASHEFLGQILIAGEKAIVADGVNRFDVYRLCALAQSARAVPREVLGRARVSRAASVGQLLALLEGRVAGEASRMGARWVFALGPLDLLADHDVKEPEARRAASRIAAVLEGFAKSGLRVVVAQEEKRLQESKREFLLEPVNAACNIVAISALLSPASRVPSLTPHLPAGFRRINAPHPTPTSGALRPRLPSRKERVGRGGAEEGASLFSVSPSPIVGEGRVRVFPSSGQEGEGS